MDEAKDSCEENYEIFCIARNQERKRVRFLVETELKNNIKNLYLFPFREKLLQIESDSVFWIRPALLKNQSIFLGFKGQFAKSIELATSALEIILSLQNVRQQKQIQRKCCKNDKNLKSFFIC